MSRYTSKLQNIQEANRKNEDRFLHEKKILMEGPNLRALIGDLESALVKKFSKESVDSFELALTKAMNPKTLITQGGQNYLKSLRGRPVSMETIEGALKLVASGQKTAEEVANLLPRQLADGTELRQVFLNKFSKSAESAAKQATPAEYRKQVSQVNSRYGAGSN